MGVNPHTPGLAGRGEGLVVAWNASHAVVSRANVEDCQFGFNASRAAVAGLRGVKPSLRFTGKCTATKGQAPLPQESTRADGWI